MAKHTQFQHQLEGKILPSVVRYIEGGGIDVGQEARAQATEDPENTISSVKRLMGRTAEEAREAGLHNYQLTQDGAIVRISAGGRSVTPIEVSSEILKVLAQQASNALGYDVTKAVITVPAYFDDTQRQATRQAGRLAGLDVMRLLNEPTAAALAYGLDKQTEGRFAVFDLGGGTFDISILNLVDGVFEVMSTGGDSQLGGDDFDRTVAEHLLRRAGIEPDDASPTLRRQALMSAEAGKKELTDSTRAVFELHLADGETHKSELTRDEYLALIKPVLDRVIHPANALKDANLRSIS